MSNLWVVIFVVSLIFVIVSFIQIVVQEDMEWERKLGEDNWEKRLSADTEKENRT